MTSAVIRTPLIRDTPTGTRRGKGASPRQRDPSALVLSWRLFRGLLIAVPWAYLSLAILVALAAGLTPWAIGQGLALLDRDFSDVRIEGDTRWVTPAALNNQLQPLIGASYFATDLASVKQRVESMPWVRSAAIGREWPGTLTVSVIEHQPVARWNDRALVSRKGDVFAPKQARVEGLPALYGPDGQAAKVLARGEAFSRLLAPLELSLVQLRLEARGAWTLLLSNGIRVALGRDRVDARFERFITVYESRLAPMAAGINGVDARYGNGVAVRWRDS